MVYELSSLEWELNPRQIQNSISKIAEKKTIKAKQTNEHEVLYNKREYYTLIEKLKKLFIKEFHRIRASINDHKIEDPEEVFIRYIATNYVGLTKLSVCQLPIKPPDSKDNNPAVEIKSQQDTLEKINNNLQTTLVIPLKKFIETTFKKELILNHLFDSPIETFLKAIKCSSVSVSRQTDQVSEDYKAIYSPNSNHLFALEYNGHRAEALYCKSLEEKFEEFQNFIEDFLEDPANVREKMKYLKKLEIKITSLQELFFVENITGWQNHPPFCHNRIDAFVNLKHKLFSLKILTDLDKFQQELMQLTEIQSLYVTRANKFVKAQIQLLEECQNWDEPILKQKKSFLETHSKTSSNSYKKLQWRGNINQLITFFYDATNHEMDDGVPILKASKKQIVRLLTENFIQKDGSTINPLTINTIFTPSKELKRPPYHKRISIPPT